MSEYQLLKASILGLPLFCAVAFGAQAQQPPGTDVAKNLTPVTDDMLRNPPAADWLMWRRTYDGYGYSPLDQINKDNVKDLQVGLDLVADQRRHRDARRSSTTACSTSGTTPTRCRR